ncbi:OmpA family protein [Alginatibacterium sediminis]|nr:OmpA family protein [Alginatibacterium sediminis]
MNQIQKMAVVLFGALSLAACSSNGLKDEYRIVCPVVGGAVGSLAGGAGAVGGAVVGALVCPVDSDTDGDGVRNSLDQCPDTPADVDVDEVGCMLTAEPMVFAGDTVSAQCADFAMMDGDLVAGFSPVHFAFDSDQFKAGQEAQLECIAAVLLANNLDAEVDGNTDALGSSDYNLDLSKRRAQNVTNYLIEAGVPSSSLWVVGNGKDKPIAENVNEEGRAENRRVDISVVR